MGYVRDKTYRLVWPEGSEFHGLEVVMRPASIKALRRLGALKPRGVKLSNEQGLEAMDEIIEILGKALVSWSLEREDTNAAGTTYAVPATVEELGEQDHELVFAIMEGWMDAFGSVPLPLSGRSTDGELSELVRSLPMEPLSTNPSSLPTLS